jgi:hypothetical protein
VSTQIERPPDGATQIAAPSDGLSSSPSDDAVTLTLAALPLGARLVLRCRKDWRVAAVAAHELELERVVLSVASPKGHTYRLRRPAGSALRLDGPIPILGEGLSWRAGLARYDARW